MPPVSVMGDAVCAVGGRRLRRGADVGWAKRQEGDDDGHFPDEQALGGLVGDEGDLEPEGEET